MSKNAKRQLKIYMEKHKDDRPRPERSDISKPSCTMVPLLDLDDCLTYAMQEKVITKIDANNILEYMKGISDESGYWDMYWGDIEDENGMTHEQALKFRAFYEIFKGHEINTDKRIWFYHLHFNVGVFT